MISGLNLNLKKIGASYINRVYELSLTFKFYNCFHSALFAYSLISLSAYGWGRSLKTKYLVCMHVHLLPRFRQGNSVEESGGKLFG